VILNAVGEIMRPAAAFLLSSPRRAAGWSVVVSVQPRPWPKPAEVIVAAVRAKYARREAPLAVQVRDRFGELFPGTPQLNVDAPRVLGG